MHLSEVASQPPPRASPTATNESGLRGRAGQAKFSPPPVLTASAVLDDGEHRQNGCLGLEHHAITSSQWLGPHAQVGAAARASRRAQECSKSFKRSKIGSRIVREIGTRTCLTTPRRAVHLRLKRGLGPFPKKCPSEMSERGKSKGPGDKSKGSKGKAKGKPKRKLDCPRFGRQVDLPPL